MLDDSEVIDAVVMVKAEVMKLMEVREQRLKVSMHADFLLNKQKVSQSSRLKRNVNLPYMH